MQSTLTVCVQDWQRGVTSQLKEQRFDYGATFRNPDLQRGDKRDDDCQRISLCPYCADLYVQHNCIAARKVALIVLIFDVSARFHSKICCKKCLHLHICILGHTQKAEIHTHRTLLCPCTHNAFQQYHVTQTRRNSCMQMQTCMWVCMCLNHNIGIKHTKTA